MRMWYQAIKCYDGKLDQEYLFGYEIFTRAVIKLSLKRTENTYSSEENNVTYPNTWNYRLENCNFIFKGE